MKEGWTVLSISDCFTNIQNGANIKQSDNARGIPITRIETLSNGVFNRDKLGHADIFEEDRYSKYILQDGDILMSHINSAKYLGRSVAYRRTDGEIIIHGMNLLRLIPIRSVIISSYAEYFFNSFYFKKQIAKITKKAVNQASFTTSDLKRLSILVPPLQEQERIVSELDLLSGIIEKQKSQLKELDILAQSIFYDMFGDPVTNEKGWEVRKLGQIISKADVVRCQTDNYPVLSMTMHDGIVFQNERFKKVIASSDTSSYKVVKLGQLVIGFPIDEGVLYFQNIIDKGIMSPAYDVWDLLTQDIIPLVLEKILHGSYAMNYYKEKLRGSTARRRTIPKEDLLSMDIIIPSMSQQQSFADKIQAIEQQKSSINRSITEMQQLFDYTMDKYFG